MKTHQNQWFVARNPMIFKEKCYESDFRCKICAPPAGQRYKYCCVISFLPYAPVFFLCHYILRFWVWFFIFSWFLDEFCLFWMSFAKSRYSVTLFLENHWISCNKSLIFHDFNWFLAQDFSATTGSWITNLISGNIYSSSLFHFW